LGIITDERVVVTALPAVSFSEIVTLDIQWIRFERGMLRNKLWRRGMQQPHVTTYAEITEVRTVTGAATCNQLLTDGWVLLGVYPLTTIGEMGARQPGDGEQQKRIEDTQRYVRRMVGYVVGRRREW
jgi:hypothetical protein